MSLELKRMKNELIQVRAARSSLEFRIEEHLENIERIKVSVKAQIDREADLEAKIQEAEKAK